MERGASCRSTYTRWMGFAVPLLGKGAAGRSKGRSAGSWRRRGSMHARTGPRTAEMPSGLATGEGFRASNGSCSRGAHPRPCARMAGHPSIRAQEDTFESKRNKAGTRHRRPRCSETERSESAAWNRAAAWADLWNDPSRLGRHPVSDGLRESGDDGKNPPPSDTQQPDRRAGGPGPRELERAAGTVTLQPSVRPELPLHPRAWCPMQRGCPRCRALPPRQP